MSKEDNENSLLKELSCGDVESFNILYRKYMPKLSCFAYQLLKDRQKAEDIVHDIFVKIWEKRANIYKVSNFNNYLFQMTKFAVYDYFDHHILEDQYSITLNKNEGSCSCDFEEKIDTDELYHLISISIENMAPQRKKIFKMSRYSGMSNKKIAESLGLSVKTIENHIGQALKDIRKAIVNMMLFIP